MERRANIVASAVISRGKQRYSLSQIQAVQRAYFALVERETIFNINSGTFFFWNFRVAHSLLRPFT